MKSCVLIALVAAVFSPQSSAVTTATWSYNDPDNWYSWSDKTKWTDGIMPGSGVRTATTAFNDQISKIRIGPEDRDCSTGLENCYVTAWAYALRATSVVEVVSGGLWSMSGRLTIGPGGGTSSKTDATLIISGGEVVNTGTINPALLMGDWKESVSRLKVTDGSLTVDKPGKLGEKGVSIVELSGGVTEIKGGITASTNSTILLNGGELRLGSSALDGPVEIHGGLLRNRSDNADISLSIGNLANSPTDARAFVLAGGMISNVTVQVGGGHFRMTGGVLSSVLKFFAAADGTAQVTMTGGRYEYRQITFQDPGRGIFLQGGGTTVLNMNVDTVNNGAGVYEMTVTNGSLLVSSEESNQGFLNPKSTNFTFRVRGTPNVELNRFATTGVCRARMAFEIDGRGVSPIHYGVTANKSIWQRFNHIRGLFTLQPYGGFQLVTTNAFALCEHGVRWEASPMQSPDDDPHSRVPNEALWETGFLSEEGAATNVWGSALRASAEIPDGYSDATGVALGWVAIPKVKSVVSRYDVLMRLEPQGDATLDGLVADINRGGYAAEKLASGDYNVKVSLPVERLGVGRTDRKVIFDFTSYDNAYDVHEGRARANAVVKALRLDRPKSGLLLLLR